MTADQINQPDVVAEIHALFHAYEHALMSNDVDTLLGFFWPDPALTRYGIADRQLGYGEMVSFRRGTAAPTFTRTLHNLRIASFGPDCAVVHVEFLRSDSALRGLQTQTWVRLPQGWKIVSAHVSMVDLAA
jgi:ketosteroid isomerase-like protein